MYHFMPGWRRVHFEFLSFSRKVFVVIWEKEREKKVTTNMSFRILKMVMWLKVHKLWGGIQFARGRCKFMVPRINQSFLKEQNS